MKGTLWLVRTGDAASEGSIREALEAAGHTVVELEEGSALLEAQARCSRQEELNRIGSALAHEVATPLAVSITATDIVRREVMSLTSPSETLNEALDLVTRNVARADRLVRGFHKVSVGLLADEREKCSITEVASEAIETLGLVMRRSHVTVRIETSLTPEESQWTGRRGALTQILINLVTNAERYAYPDKQPGTAHISLERRGEVFEIRVRDHGIGVPGEHREQLFQPFFSSGRDRGGSGLGLAILHQLVTRDLGGEVTVEFPADGGTEFRLVLPVVSPE